MNKHILFAATLIVASANSFAAETEKALMITLALYDGSEAPLLQPVELDKQTAKVAEQRVDSVVEALNDKLSKQMEAKFAEDLRVTSR